MQSANGLFAIFLTQKENHSIQMRKLAFDCLSSISNP